MKKHGHAQKSKFSALGYLSFFLLVCGVATCSILAFSFILDKSGGDKLLTAILTLVVLLVLALVCTIIDAVRRKRTVERPVQSIVAATAQLAEGDFAIRLKLTHSYGKYDEFDLIMENINRMARELSKNELMKLDFIANVSHEIKTPLALIQNYATGLCNEKLSKDERNEYIQTLLSASTRLTDLITNILKLNKLENQEIFPQRSDVQLGEHLRECVLAFEDRIEQKQLELNCDIDDITLYTDGGLLEIVWNNLLSNAIKFTDNGGAITVSLKVIEKFAEVMIADSGCGISSLVGERIFDKFYQGDNSHSTQGNGLGLALVKRVVDILGAEISVDSQEGVGSTFVIRLRLNDEER